MRMHFKAKRKDWGGARIHFDSKGGQGIIDAIVCGGQHSLRRREPIHIR